MGWLSSWEGFQTILIDMDYLTFFNAMFIFIFIVIHFIIKTVSVRPTQKGLFLIDVLK